MPDDDTSGEARVGRVADTENVVGSGSQTEYLESRLLEVIGRGAERSLPEGEFDELARQVFTYQFQHNSLYGRFCEVRGLTPAGLRGWLDIPAVPTDAFKAAPLLCGDPADAAVVFRTSGTSAGNARRGAHYLLRTRLYEAALRAGFRAALTPDRSRIRILSLIPAAEELPDSSLSFMMRDVRSVFGDDGSGIFMTPTGLKMDELMTACRTATEDGAPVLIAGTSFAFVHLLDAMNGLGVALELPAGSRIMDTGGYKGRSREVSRSELYLMLSAKLGISMSFIVNEYGMTEMSSQLYDGVAGAAAEVVTERRHIGPAWVRTVAVDPETLEPLPPGEVGILRHVDLANLYSVAALQTSDLGRVTADGVELLGRAAGAEARGCSVAVEELLTLLEG